MASKKKPSLAMVIASTGAKPEPEEPDDEKDADEDDGAHEAMGEMHDALKAGDMPRAMSAFRALHDLCCADHESNSKEYDEAETKE